MSTRTTNLNFFKYTGSDKPDLTLVNENFDKLDGILGQYGSSKYRWLRPSFTNHKAVVITSGTSIILNSGSSITIATDTTYDLSANLTQAGSDYYIYMADDGTVSASLDGTDTTKTLIGRCHTLCASVPSSTTMILPASPSCGLTTNDTILVKPYKEDEDADFYAFYNKSVQSVKVQTAYDVVTCAHPLAGYDAGDILPESIFCTTFKPDCLYVDGMVYDKTTDKAIDIYLQSGTGYNTRSKYGATHTVSRTAYNHFADMMTVGKKLLTDYEFTSAALGSNECTAIYGAADASTVGGHSDTAGRRMISAIGCEEMCGYLWQWLDEVSPSGGSSFATTDSHGSFGQEYGTPYVLRAGGHWSDSSSCGSRSRVSDNGRSGVGGLSGGRGSSRVKRGNAA